MPPYGKWWLSKRTHSVEMTDHHNCQEATKVPCPPLNLVLPSLSADAVPMHTAGKLRAILEQSLERSRPVKTTLTMLAEACH